MIRATQAHLVPGEGLIGLFRVVNFNPSMDYLAVTSRRLLGLSYLCEKINDRGSFALRDIWSVDLTDKGFVEVTAHPVDGTPGRGRSVTYKLVESDDTAELLACLRRVRPRGPLEAGTLGPAGDPVLGPDGADALADSSTPGELAAALERIAGLHAGGALTDEEFAAAKARMLGLG
ncbi:MAG: SHOCT domain-containing protein [Micrococcales bacterium]|nr:SHOCT domain-containing protein [Micrococcales bacterium]